MVGRLEPDTCTKCHLVLFSDELWRLEVADGALTFGLDCAHVSVGSGWVAGLQFVTALVTYFKVPFILCTDQADDWQLEVWMDKKNLLDAVLKYDVE